MCLLSLHMHHTRKAENDPSLQKGITPETHIAHACSICSCTSKLGPVHRYYICDKKLAALGWVEKTSWEEGLKKTIDWYLEHGFESRWVGDVERALAAHPKAQ